LFICIYCGNYSKNIIDFRYIKEDGLYSTSLFKCNKCGNIMKENTIKMNLNLYEWVEYLYLNIRVTEGFYEKIEWELYFSHLKELGMNKDFWDYWKVFKRKCENKDKMMLFEELVTLVKSKRYKKPLKQMRLI